MGNNRKMSGEKISLLIPILMGLVIFGAGVYFLFFSECPYEWGADIKQWMSQRCPYIAKGVLVDRISKEPVGGAKLSFPQGEVYSSANGAFFIKVRGYIGKVVIAKAEYHTQEVEVSFDKENKEIDFGQIYLEPEAKITGKIVDWISEGPISGANLSFGKGVVNSSSDGEFVVRTTREIGRGDIKKIVILKEGYNQKEVEANIPEDTKEIDLGKISLVPEGRVVYQGLNEKSMMRIYSLNFDGTEMRELLPEQGWLENKIIRISPNYEKLVFQGTDPRDAQNSQFFLVNTDGTNETRMAYKTPSAGPTEGLYTFKFSGNGNLVAWMNTWTEKEKNQTTVFYFNSEGEKYDSVRMIFDFISSFQISPDGKYIAVKGTSIQNKRIVYVEDIINHRQVFQGDDANGFFFDDTNFYYEKDSWYSFNLKDNKTQKLNIASEDMYNKSVGLINPRNTGKMVILKQKISGWSFYLADSNGLNEKKIAQFKDLNGYISDVTWGPGGKYVLFTIFESPYPYENRSLWVLDVESGNYKKIIDEKIKNQGVIQKIEEDKQVSDQKNYMDGIEKIKRKDWGWAKDLLLRVSENFPLYSDAKNILGILAEILDCQYRKGEYRMKITDSQGRVTGMVDGNIKEEIPNSIYSEEENMAVILDPRDNYIYDFFAVKAGNYQFTLNSMLEGEMTEFYLDNIPISVGATHRVQVNETEEKAILSIDDNSDGKFEKEILFDKKLTCEEFIVQTKMPEIGIIYR